MDPDKDLKDNQPRRSKWLMFCVPLMIISFSAIFLIPLGIFYLKPQLHARKLAALNANKLIQVPPGVALGPDSSSKASSKAVADPDNISSWKLPSSWSDSVSANPFLPRLDQDWQYGKKPVHGVVLNSWLHLNTSIIPSLGENEGKWSAQISGSQGTNVLKKQLEAHYQHFLTESDFAEIAEAGLDHIKIPIGYWALQAPESDPHLSSVSWQYFLRGLEWARKYGLRVCVTITGDDPVPEDFSSRVAAQFAKFIAQKRYQRLVTMLEVAIPGDSPNNLYKTIRNAGFKGVIVGQDVDATSLLMPPNTFKYQDRLATVCGPWQQSLGSSGGPQLVEWNLNDGGTLGNVDSPLYRAYLKDFAKGQIAVYDAKTWGWFHGSWKGNDVRQSYQKGLEASVLPNFNATGPAVQLVCDASTDYALMGLIS